MAQRSNTAAILLNSVVQRHDLHNFQKWIINQHA